MQPSEAILPRPERRLAAGRTAEVFVWQPGTVLKLFFPGFPAEVVDHEFRNAVSLRDSGLTVHMPIPLQQLQIGERHGIVYSHAPGSTMLESLRSHPWRMPALARQLADLHRSIHACTAPAKLPAQKQRLVTKISRAPDLSAALRDRLLARLEEMPDASGLCHGDFHPGNIIHGDNQTPVVIDWTDATCGHPLADVARTVILIEGALASGQVHGRLSIGFLRLFLALYLRRYFAANTAQRSDLACWRPLVAAARLAEGIDAERPWLLAQASAIDAAH